MTAPDRWEPDVQLVASLLAGPRPELKLHPADRCWAVAGLTLAGRTAEDIAERIGRSLRLVRTIRAEPMTQLCMFYMQESEAFASESRLARSEYQLLGETLNATEAELTRTKEKLRNLITNRTPLDGSATFPKCQHPMDRYNTYEHRGKRFCRTCHREGAAERRRNKRSVQPVPTEGDHGRA